MWTHTHEHSSFVHNSKKTRAGTPQEPINREAEKQTDAFMIHTQELKGTNRGCYRGCFNTSDSHGRCSKQLELEGDGVRAGADEVRVAWEGKDFNVLNFEKDLGYMITRSQQTYTTSVHFIMCEYYILKSKRTVKLLHLCLGTGGRIWQLRSLLTCTEKLGDRRERNLCGWCLVTQRSYVTFAVFKIFPTWRRRLWVSSSVDPAWNTLFSVWARDCPATQGTDVSSWVLLRF